MDFQVIEVFGVSHSNKIIESPHGIMSKNLHSINSAPSHSKTEVPLTFGYGLLMGDH